MASKTKPPARRTRAARRFEAGASRSSLGAVGETGKPIVRPSPAPLSVYDGQLRLGAIRDFGDHVTAHLVDGKQLGTFADRAHAISAIRAAALRA